MFLCGAAEELEIMCWGITTGPREPCWLLFALGFNAASRSNDPDQQLPYTTGPRKGTATGVRNHVTGWVSIPTTRNLRPRPRVRHETSKGHLQGKEQFDRKAVTGTRPTAKGQRWWVDIRWKEETEIGVKGRKGQESGFIILHTITPGSTSFTAGSQSMLGRWKDGQNIRPENKTLILSVGNTQETKMDTPLRLTLILQCSTSSLCTL